jgi:large subunit ribosomal protein L25
VIALDVAGDRKLAMVRELQVHPLTRAVQHVDFYEVSLERTIDVRVPFFTEGRAKGVIAGGEITAIFREVPLRATPDRVPSEIRVDVTNMELGHVMRVKDLALPEGVSALLDPERSLVTCAEPRKRPTEEDEAAAAGTPGAPAAATGTTTPPAAAAAAKPAAKPAKGKG